MSVPACQSTGFGRADSGDSTPRARGRRLDLRRLSRSADPQGFGTYPGSSRKSTPYSLEAGGLAGRSAREVRDKVSELLRVCETCRKVKSKGVELEADDEIAAREASLLVARSNRRVWNWRLEKLANGLPVVGSQGQIEGCGTGG